MAHLRTMRAEEYLQNGLRAMCGRIKAVTQVDKMCEIGTYRGESSKIFLEEFPDLEAFVGVDPYSMAYNSDGLFSPDLLLEIENEFRSVIASRSDAVLVKAASKDAAILFPDSHFDFIYIDGCHQRASVISDIESWRGKVKSGGFIGFHDVDNEQVRGAISEFYNINDGQIFEDNSIIFRMDN